MKNIPTIICLLASFVLTIAESAARPVYGVSRANGYAVRGTRGAIAVGDNRAVAVTRRRVAVTGPTGTAVARRPLAAPLPRGYIRTIPPGYRRVAYRGFNCYYVGGIYYRAVIYGGATTYVIVT